MIGLYWLATWWCGTTCRGWSQLNGALYMWCLTYIQNGLWDYSAVVKAFLFLFLFSVILKWRSIRWQNTYILKKDQNCLWFEMISWVQGLHFQVHFAFDLPFVVSASISWTAAEEDRLWHGKNKWNIVQNITWVGVSCSYRIGQICCKLAMAGIFQSYWIGDYRYR